MGLFDKEKKKKADFSNVQSGSSTNAPKSAPGKAMDPASQRTSESTTYTVRKGDTLSAIAQRTYGDANEWRRIYEANRDSIDNPDLIHPGQELNIPRDERGSR